MWRPKRARPFYRCQLGTKAMVLDPIVRYSDTIMSVVGMLRPSADSRGHHRLEPISIRGRVRQHNQGTGASRHRSWEQEPRCR